MSEIAEHKHGPSSAQDKLDILKSVFVFLLAAAAIVGNGYFDTQPLLYRAVGVVVLACIALAVFATTEKGRWALDVCKEARIEMRRVVWPTRQETLQTTLGVVIMVLIVALFLWLLDALLNAGVASLIG